MAAWLSDSSRTSQAKSVPILADIVRRSGHLRSRGELGLGRDGVCLKRIWWDGVKGRLVRWSGPCALPILSTEESSDLTRVGHQNINPPSSAF